ncbi:MULTISPECIES: septum formation family protein [unclassified Micromonospora]|uniref:septum formation family protein n=1 Tax=unclassified Micromonospora TaxID=2617518 RepID=UPI002FF05666
MRRWWTAVAVGGLALLALTGCGAPAGLDVDLTDDWPALAAPQGFVPAAGVCHADVQDVGYLSGYRPVDCAQSHRAETMHVGTFAGAEARRSTPPAGGTPAMLAARAECDRAVRRAVGADWRSGRLGLAVVFPSAAAWTGGARWFRCDLTEVASIDESRAVPRTGSLKGALTRDTDLRLRCFEPKVKGDEVEAMAPVSCTARHHAEFVGVWAATDLSYAQLNRGDDRVHKGCMGVLAKYTGVPNDGNLRFRAGSIFYHPLEREWRDGNRGVQCFLWVGDRNLTRSLKGVGTRGLPVR